MADVLSWHLWPTGVTPDLRIGVILVARPRQQAKRRGRLVFNNVAQLCLMTKMMRSLVVVVGLVLLGALADGLWADGEVQRPVPSVGQVLSFPWRAITDVDDFLKKVDPREKWDRYLWIAGLTGLMLPIDQAVLDGSQRLARQMGLLGPHDDGRQSHVIGRIRWGEVRGDLNLPKGPNAFMYFIGDGLTPLFISTGMLTYGWSVGDGRAVSAAAQVLEAISLTGLFIITLKMSTGRESPFRATVPGGRWRGFPGLRTYLLDMSAYDAYPSGHIATVMAWLRILGENFPEKRWIYPTGYVAMGLLMFAMLNNGVHWLSDYPLGIAIGYVAGDTVLEQHGVLPRGEHESSLPAWMRGIRLYANGHSLGLTKTWNF